jgi:D-Tyr-tRNA(Tyr) deacylase
VVDEHKVALRLEDVRDLLMDGVVLGPPCSFLTLGFGGAARPEAAEPVYEAFCAELRALGVVVETGVFGAAMQVELVNDGPVTIVLES